MNNIASILGLLLPSALCVFLVVVLKSELNATSSGEAATGIIAGGTFIVLGSFVASCFPNVICTIVAARRKEKLWKLSTLGIPLCAVLTVLTVILTK